MQETPAPQHHPRQTIVACWPASFNGCLSLVLAPNCMCRCSGPLKTQGPSITPDLAPRKLGVFRRCPAGSNALGCAGIQSGPAGIGSCRIPPSICGAPLARCNVFAPPSSASFPNFTNPPATLHEHMVQSATSAPASPIPQQSPLHSGVLQTWWELMEGPKWSPPHGAKGPTMASPTKAAAPHALDRACKLNDSVRSVASFRCPAEIRLHSLAICLEGLHTSSNKEPTAA